MGIWRAKSRPGNIYNVIMKRSFGSFVMMGIIMVYLHIITVNALSLLFHIYNNESIENKHIFFTFNFTVRTLIWHLTVYSLRP